MDEISTPSAYRESKNSTLFNASILVNCGCAGLELLLPPPQWLQGSLGVKMTVVTPHFDGPCGVVKVIAFSNASLPMKHSTYCPVPKGTANPPAFTVLGIVVTW